MFLNFLSQFLALCCVNWFFGAGYPSKKIKKFPYLYYFSIFYL